MKKAATWFSLFASTSTLVCCALPSLLVVLGMGATMAGLVSGFPQIIWLSQHKAWVFSGSALALALAGFLQHRARHQACPTDQELAEACADTRNWAGMIWWTSLGMWVIGAFFAFVAPLVFFRI